MSQVLLWIWVILGISLGAYRIAFNVIKDNVKTTFSVAYAVREKNDIYYDTVSEHNIDSRSGIITFQDKNGEKFQIIVNTNTEITR